MALGARTENVRRLAMRHGLTPAFVGVVVGVIGALAATQLAASLLHGVAPRDPLTFVGVVALLVLVALGASWLPARRATRVDPIIALREPTSVRRTRSAARHRAVPLAPLSLSRAAGCPTLAAVRTYGGGCRPPASCPDFDQRRYDLDWMRIGAFLLLILYHVGMYYVTWDWHVKSPYASSRDRAADACSRRRGDCRCCSCSGSRPRTCSSARPRAGSLAALRAAARAARVRHARDRAAAVVSRGRREGAVRGQLRRVLAVFTSRRIKGSAATATA